MTTESPVQIDIMRLGRGPVRLFRNTVGTGWMGKAERLKTGGVLIRSARFVTFGLFPGSADVIGWRTITITPDMVGKQIAQFVSIEAKGDETRVRDGQPQWRANVLAAGGCAGIARSREEAASLLNEEP